MLLNKVIREAVVSRIMADIPQHDYLTQATDLIAKFVKDKTPPQILKLQSSQELSPWATASTAFYGGSFGCLTVRVPSKTSGLDQLQDAVKELARQSADAKADRANLRAKVEATLAVCKTSKDVEERFPDFVKYLPQTAQEALLPSTTDLMDTLKAAGWKKAK